MVGNPVPRVFSWEHGQAASFFPPLLSGAQLASSSGHRAWFACRSGLSRAQSPARVPLVLEISLGLWGATSGFFFSLLLYPGRIREGDGGNKASGQGWRASGQGEITAEAALALAWRLRGRAPSCAAGPPPSPPPSSSGDPRMHLCLVAAWLELASSGSSQGSL